MRRGSLLSFKRATRESCAFLLFYPVHYLILPMQYIRWRFGCQHSRCLHARPKKSVSCLHVFPATQCGSHLSTCIVAVTEGYLSSPPSSPLKQAPAISLAAAASYTLTARENNRQVFSASSGSYSPLPSPSKRKRSHPDSHDDDEQSITPFFVTPQSQDRGHLAMELCGDDMEVDSLDRPMKPLRRSGRIREVSPLPPTRSLLPCETEMNSHQCEEESTNMHSTQLL